MNYPLSKTAGGELAAQCVAQHRHITDRAQPDRYRNNLDSAACWRCFADNSDAESKDERKCATCSCRSLVKPSGLSLRPILGLRPCWMLNA